MERYTRQVTLAWTVYFCAMAALSIALLVARAVRGWVAVRQPADPARAGRDVRRRIPAALSAAPGVRAGEPARDMVARLLAPRGADRATGRRAAAMTRHATASAAPTSTPRSPGATAGRSRAAQYLADVLALAGALPASGAPLNLTADRYRFAVGLGAAMLRGQHQPAAAEPHAGHGGAAARPVPRRLCARRRRGAPASGLPTRRIDCPRDAPPTRPRRCRASTPRRHRRPGAHLRLDRRRRCRTPSAGRLLVANIAGRGRPAGASTLRPRDLDGVTLVGTVPAQHMYGFESTVLIALLGGAAFDGRAPVLSRPTSSHALARRAAAARAGDHAVPPEDAARRPGVDAAAGRPDRVRHRTAVAAAGRARRSSARRRR